MSGEINWIIFATSLALLVAALLVLIRALLGPTLYDRILAVNAMGTKTVIFLVLPGLLGPPRTGQSPPRRRKSAIASSMVSGR